MNQLPSIAVSVGDLNGISSEILLRSHEYITLLCHPIYCVDREILLESARLLKIPLPDKLKTEPIGAIPPIQPGKICPEMGRYSYRSFKKAIGLTQRGRSRAIVTLPVNKSAWQAAGIRYAGHTEALRALYQQKAIMMIGCNQLFVGLYTDHVLMRQVPGLITEPDLTDFLLHFFSEIQNPEAIGVLGLNPHAETFDAPDAEERIIEKSIKNANTTLNKKIFEGPLSPDGAFNPQNRKKYKYLVAMYHDQGLAPLKALFFEESINITLGLPIIRVSVDHGTAFDMAYKNLSPSLLSYRQAIQSALDFCH